MSEVQFYLVNGAIGALALMAFFMFRSWYKALEHRYTMSSLVYDAEKTRDNLRAILNSVSQYEVEKLKKTLKEFGTTVSLQQAIDWFREQRSADLDRIKKLEDKVNFLWENGAPK